MYSYVFTVYDCSNCMHVGPCQSFRKRSYEPGSPCSVFSCFFLFSTVFLHFTKQIKWWWWWYLAVFVSESVTTSNTNELLPATTGLFIYCTYDLLLCNHFTVQSVSKITVYNINAWYFWKCYFHLQVGHWKRNSQLNFVLSHICMAHRNKNWSNLMPNIIIQA